MKQASYSVYLLRDPRDGIVRYVGVTGNLTHRFQIHLSNVTKPKPGEVRRREWIKELAAIDAVPVVEVAFSSTEKFAAHFVEKAFQAKHADTILNSRVAKVDLNQDPTVLAGLLSYTTERLRDEARHNLHASRRGRSERDRRHLREHSQRLHETVNALPVIHVHHR